VRKLIGWSRSPGRHGHLAIVAFVFGIALLGAGSMGTNPSTATTALKPIDQSALQTMVDATARELLVPAAFVLLRTPQGEFTVSYGTTQLGSTSPPNANTYFRIASNTKTMTAAVILQLAQEGKLGLADPVSKYVPSVPDGDKITIAELLDMRSVYTTTQTRRSSRRASTVTRLRFGPRPNYWPLRSHTRPSSRPVRATSTAIPTTRCLALSPKRSVASRWPR
jgi:CubicO group peptidase (beta-lactamase class C family)